MRAQLIRTAVLEIYEEVRREGARADQALQSVLRREKLLRSVERRAVSDAVYGLLRLQGRVDHLLQRALGTRKLALEKLATPTQHLLRYAAYLVVGERQSPESAAGLAGPEIATWSWAFGTLYTKKQAASFNPYFSLGLQMLISGLFLLLFTNLTGQAVAYSAIPWQSLAAIGYLVVFGSVISFIAYLYALQNLSAEQTSLYAYINPIVAVLLGWLIFSEKLTVFIAIGGAVTLIGVYLVNKAYKIPLPVMPETEGI